MTKRVMSLVLLMVIFFNLSLGLAQQKRSYTSIRIPNEGKYIAITFDDGPGPHTARLLEILSQHQVRATFFVVGQMVEQRPGMIPQILNGGHEIGNHTYHHWVYSQVVGTDVSRKSVPKFLDTELRKTHDLIQQYGNGTQAKLMRPPGGDLPPWAARLVEQELGYSVVLWSVDCGDTRKDPRTHNWPGKDRIKQNILSHTKPGSIILAHDIKKATVDAMDETIAELKRRGFEFVTVSELLAMENQTAQTPQPAPTPTPTPAIDPPPATVVPPPTAPAAAPSPESAPSLFTYVVKNGDNLGKICRRFKCDANQVARLSGISDPSKIFAGQELKIPRR